MRADRTLCLSPSRADQKRMARLAESQCCPCRGRCQRSARGRRRARSPSASARRPASAIAGVTRVAPSVSVCGSRPARDAEEGAARVEAPGCHGVSLRAGSACRKRMGHADAPHSLVLPAETRDRCRARGACGDGDAGCRARGHVRPFDAQRRPATVVAPCFKAAPRP